MIRPVESVLARLCAPRDPAHFLAEIMGRQAAHLSGDLARFGSFYSVAEWERRELPGPVDAANVDADGRQHQRRIGLEEVDQELRGGATICADVTRHPGLAPLLDDLQRDLGTAGYGFAKLYVSPPGGGFALHADGDHVFVVQVAGRKRWRFGQVPAVPHAREAMAAGPAGVAVMESGAPVLGDDGAPVSAPREEDLAEAVLEPGHCLYLPPGTWHRARAEGTSVAVSVSPGRQSAAEVLLTLLGSLSRRDPELARDLWCPPGGMGAPDPEFSRRLRGLARRGARLLRELGPGEALQAWYRARPPIVAGAVSGADASPGPDRMLHRVPGVVHVEAPATDGPGDAIFIYTGREELELPGEAKPFVDHLFRTERFRAGDVPSWVPGLAWDDAVVLLDELLAAGVIAHDD